MGKQLAQLTPALEEFIAAQKIFFVGTAMAEGRVNISPKGMDSFRVLSPSKIIWLNLTGSGNETATHLLERDRMTIMFCAFEGKPLILRLYGHAKIFHPRDEGYGAYIGQFPEIKGSRQIIEMEVDLVQTSCGMAVPFMDFKEERTELEVYWQQQGDERIHTYWEEKNTTSLDGHETKILG
ncbi:pyridoxamine 5'-phosphate oxidase family protein [Reichenbachiella agariperforans]|uniref:pyridoxamine 5'-phosphate oxidase family protein n=1 Tax=Reichenbachiella agariperforans TaxID=156994 RepID=UPI001C081ACC|nr:pyridoxamine 5'-phosphate oxidase family protein [Reichenbachiella agariperforans]MBU2915384.1 pyridoxamine 5'-phosphate oxidase family protein [Reichenbachiella agariperforans]